VKGQVDRAPDAKFIFNDETKQLDLKEDSKVGRALDMDASIKAINDALLRGEHTVPLAVAETQPQIPGNTTGQQLGITELLWAETSYFYGSSNERIQNIKAAAERFHGVLVAPGEIFSMGETMGDVSLESGFAEALIIYGGRTIKGVGGGVVSGEHYLFRGFQRGLSQLWNVIHTRIEFRIMKDASGAVDPNLAGLDATVYFPLVDFKFKNDSPYWILMETYLNEAGRSLTWKFYSTKDGRSLPGKLRSNQCCSAPSPRL
jgi:vancomycin resistance protein YoaR